MITTSYYSSSRYSTSNNGYDGVVRIASNGSVGTGALLYDGRAVLTAAHLLDGVSSAEVTFLINGVKTRVSSSDYLLHPSADTTAANNDLAILWLDSTPITAERYQIYRDSDEIGQTFTMAGFGQYGEGASATRYNGSDSVRYKAQNTFDVTGDEFKQGLGSEISWTPASGTQLLADFDNGSAANDAFGMLLGVNDLGLGADEGLIAPGDSGGSAFIDGVIAGVASYTASVSTWWADTDIDEVTNSSFGELAAWQRVSHYQRWIDQSVREHYDSAPESPAEVQLEVVEGDSGSSYAYFMVSFNGDRGMADDIISVDYQTRDGSATAGEDYLALSGTLNIYDDESYALIAVEVLGDQTVEDDEAFYLDITNPLGGSFGDGVVTLTAMRTILNDDLI
ncbi:Calx-beta domain protein [Marinomonas aquimarina]|uniref:Calx-beta domain protein n=2 Tax=Marinomonas aquimarina TaxID=295068 RepID=A0A1A8T295_9GAMM|nr:Calx-beta domain protein [Marinomonas aquimarina]